MRIDHLVVNVDKKYQVDTSVIDIIRQSGLPYEPKWGKGTRGFKASNLWIGNEYLEMIHLLKQDGGGWKEDWVEAYNVGHRGLICLMLDVEDMDVIYKRMQNHQVQLTKPEYLQFKWGFGLFTRTMPWRNSYFNFFKGIPLQIGLQQMKDEKAYGFMQQYMVPNSKDNGIDGIREMLIRGPFTEADKYLINNIFENARKEEDKLIICLKNNQRLIFQEASHYEVSIKLACNNEAYKGKCVRIENININN